ncbi:MAG: class 1 isoprenoid biosynthesis enzyme [Candidatus Pacearchaeota archaeon]|nr:class 1 isoprenoid biosynthesis enzyme [Candidatus Pacearchaeota archaeon]
MEYQNLEKEYNKIFNEKVLPFINKNIKKDFCSNPVYYLLEGLQINRFRSALPIILAREYGKDEENMLALSAFCELTFTTAMAQDDYYDGDEIREGLVAVHKLFGSNETLLSCDYINHKCISLLSDYLLKHNISDSKRNRILNIANEGMKLWYLSVLMELNSKKDLFLVEEEYLRQLYLSKTIHGRMLLECTFLMIQDEEKIIELIKRYSEHLAIAGQLKNDIYDFTKHQKYRGLSDLRQGHITWPLYILIKSLDDSEKGEFSRNLQNKNYENLINLFKQKKVIEKTLELINFHVEKAKEIIKDNIDDFPKNVSELLNLWAEGNRNFSKEPKL